MNVLITGGSRGIGKAIADKFRSENYTVITPTRKELDLSKKESIEQYINDRSMVFDIIINNAGVNYIGELSNIDSDTVIRMVNTNLIAPILLLRTLTQGMKARQFGRIVNLGSIFGVVSKEGRSVYSATKNGLHGLTNSLALELAPYNVLVNTVCPGYTMTEMTLKNNTHKEIEEIVSQIPLGRLADPYEIAAVVFYLCSKENSYITGQKIIVDGGFTVKW